MSMLEWLMRSDRVAVVGGGIAGLVAALHLARRGHRVVVFEATRRVGGRAQTRTRDHVCFNQGPHALYVAGALNQALIEFGVAVAGGPPDLAAGWALWPSGETTLPLTGKHDPLSDAFTRTLIDAFTAAADWQGAHDAESPCLSDVLSAASDEGRAIVEAFVRLSTYTHAPHSLDARAALEQLRLSAAGTLYLDGGWQTLVDALESMARRAGVDLRPGSRVKAVRARTGHCLLDSGDGAEGAFGAVILAVPPHQAASIASESQELAAGVGRLTPVRLVGLDLALAALPRPEMLFALAMHEPLYLSVHSAAARLAPDGKALLHVARYLAPDEAPAPAHLAQLEALLDDLQPGWRAALADSQRLSGATVAWDFPQAARGGRRQPVALADLPGVFLAGDWVGETGLLADAAAASARVAADSVIHFLAA